MRDNGVRAALDLLLDADPAIADRVELGEMLRTARLVRGWIDACDVQLARRNRELVMEGRSESMALIDEGRRSGKEVGRTEGRAELCDRMYGFEDALANGDVSSDHLDVLARLTKNLSDRDRSDVDAIASDLLASATSTYVSQFEREAKAAIATIAASNQTDDHDDAAVLDRQRAASKVSRWVDSVTGMHKTLIELDPLRDEQWWTSIDAETARRCQQDGNSGRPWAQVRIEAIVDRGTCHGAGERQVPEVSVLIDLVSLTSGSHAATLCETSSGVDLPVTTVRRLCCEAEIVPIVLGGKGEVLDVGRASRTATRAQRRALRALHRTCAHEHCTVPFDACRIHHVAWWWNGGTSDLENLVPLCEEHHHLVHEGRWSLTMTPERIATWTRPDGTVWHTGSTIDRRPAGRADASMHVRANRRSTREVHQRE